MTKYPIGSPFLKSKQCPKLYLEMEYQDKYQAICQRLNEADITLELTYKRVKNINFRIKPNVLCVSAPHRVREADLINALSQRVDWAIDKHPDVLKRHQQKQHLLAQTKTPQPLILWGEQTDLELDEDKRIECYRKALAQVMPELFAKWEPVVGKQAKERRIRKMKTRWGTCNSRAKRIWLSVYLPAYPIECTEYVIVHELCHLHHANHSAKFWAEVNRAMPDYKLWHDMLAGKAGQVD